MCASSSSVYLGWTFFELTVLLLISLSGGEKIMSLQNNCDGKTVLYLSVIHEKVSKIQRKMRTAILCFNWKQFVVLRGKRAFYAPS